MIKKNIAFAYIRKLEILAFINGGSYKEILTETFHVVRFI
jgi:hypothetical protein